MGDEALRDEELAVVNLEHVKRISDTFRPNSVRKNGSIQKTVVQEIWKTRLAPRFYSALMNVMFPGDAKEVSFLSFYTIYKNLAEPEAEIVFRALTIYHIATIHEPPFNYEQADEYPNAPFMNIKAYVCDVITSYLHAIIHINMKEPLGWLELKASNGIMEGNLVAAYLLKDLEAHRNEVSIGSLEIWLEKSEIYYTVSVELYLYLFGVNKTIDVKSLVPFPIVQTGKNSRTLMSLPDVLLLNSKLPKRAPRWTLAFMLDSRTGDWEKFKQAIYGKGQTLIVIQDSNGDIFGMYGSQQWVPSTGFYGNDQSFLFTLKPDVNVYESSGRNNNFQIFTETGIGLGGTEGSPGLFINWNLRVGTTSPQCVTFDKFWQLSRDLVFDIKLLELWVVDEVLTRKDSVIPRDFYNTVVMWSRIGQNKPMPNLTCHCGNRGFGAFQAQIEETDIKYFRTSEESSEQLCIGECVATQTSTAHSVCGTRIFKTSATSTSRTTLGLETAPYLRYMYPQHLDGNCFHNPRDNYACHNVQDTKGPPFQPWSPPPRRTGCHKSTSSPLKTEGQTQRCGAGGCGTNAAASTSDGWMPGQGGSGTGSVGLCTCCGVPKAMCPYNTGLCTCCGVPKAMCPYNTRSTGFNPPIAGTHGEGLGNCGCGRTGGKPGLTLKEMKAQVKQMKNEEKRRKKHENDILKRERKEEKRIIKEKNRRRKQERKKARKLRKMRGPGVPQGGDNCDCCKCKGGGNQKPSERPKIQHSSTGKKDCNCPTNSPFASAHPPCGPPMIISCGHMLDIPRTPTVGTIACPPCPPKPPSTMMYTQKPRYDLYPSTDELINTQSHCGCVKKRGICSCRCTKVANYSVMVQHTGLEYSELESVDPTEMQNCASSSAMELPPSIEIGNGDSNESAIIGNLLKRQVPILTPLPPLYTRTDNVLINVSERKGEPGTNGENRNKHLVPPCILYLDCTKMKDMCVIIRNKCEES